MTQKDLDNYAVRVAPAQQGTYRGRKVYTTSAPSSGSVLLHMLNLAEQFDDSFLSDGHTALNSHRIVELLKCKSLFINAVIATNSRVQMDLQLGISLIFPCMVNWK